MWRFVTTDENACPLRFVLEGWACALQTVIFCWGLVSLIEHMVTK